MALALDAIVVVPAMAAPPTPVMWALEGIAAPIVIWNAPRIATIGPDLTQKDATVHTTAVACVMLANTLLRQGRRFAVVTANPGDAVAMTELHRSMNAVAAASTVRGATAIRIGDVMPGYSDVEASAVQLSELGVTEQSVGVEELNGAFSDVSEDEAHADCFRRLRGWAGDTRPANKTFRVRGTALTLERLMDAHEAAFGTVNCHGLFFRGNNLIGITACLGVSLLSSSGDRSAAPETSPLDSRCNWRRRLAGGALLQRVLARLSFRRVSCCSRRGAKVTTHGVGRVPSRICSQTVTILERSVKVPRCLSRSIMSRRRFSLSPLDHGWRLSWATGEIVDSRYPRMGGPNAMFRFDSGHVKDAGNAWIGSGATHHHALADGRLDLKIPLLAAALGVEDVRV